MQGNTRCTSPALPALGAILVAVLTTPFAAPTMAQTPDFLPPAMETVCDGETGAAFGWCNAYCEAMDCELANDNDPLTEPDASSTACEQVRSKFRQNTGRDLPCEVTCPCTDNPEAFRCIQDGQFCVTELGFPASLCEPPEGNITAVLGEPLSIVFATSLGLPVAGVPFPFCGDQVGGVLPLTPEQGVECKAQLEAVVDASGLVCNL